MEKEETIKLLVPLYVTNRQDFFPGFGLKELYQSLFGIIPGAIISFIIYFISKSSLYIIVLIGFVIVSVSLCIKDTSNQSIIDYIANAIKFSKSIKYLKYEPVYEYD